MKNSITKICSPTGVITYFNVILGLSMLPFLAKSETVTAFGIPGGNIETQTIMEGQGIQSVSRLSDLDTDTGEHTNSQYFTSRSSGDFTAMDRDEAGTLYVIHEPNRLLTLDETTGVATDVVTVTDGMFPSPLPLRVPAMAFGPSPIASVASSSQEVLYAIIKREGGVVVQDKGAAPSSDDYGFILVTINLVTGETQDTGIYIGGQKDGRGHGLIYDPELDRLIHGYFGTPPGIDTSDGTTVEVINPYTGEVHVAAHGLMPITKAEETADDTVGSFSGMASLGEGVFLVYDNRDSQQLFVFRLIENDDVAAFGSATVGKGAPILGDYYYGFDVAGDGSTYYGSIRAMALTLDGYSFLTEMNGDLIIYDKEGNAAPTPPVPTSVGGYPLYLSSIVTQPKTGNIYGLSDRGMDMASLNEKAKGGMPKGPGGGAGLYRLDRNGPMTQELTELDVVFFTNSGSSQKQEDESDKGSEVNIYAIVAITFDEFGNLYGYDADYEQIVRINLATGEVTAHTGKIGAPGENVQLEYNPDNGLFYILSNAGSGQGQLTLTSVAGDGTEIKEIPLTGDFPDIAADSLVYAGAGKFFFTVDFMGHNAKMMPLGEDLVLCVDTLGNVEVVSAPLPPAKIVVGSTFTTTGLSKSGIPPAAATPMGSLNTALMTAFNNKIKKLKKKFKKAKSSGNSAKAKKIKAQIKKFKMKLAAL